nr:lipopolysaccharide-induced tumor necrosis factor-alpha factor homolog isoform X2 [Misgurnus anguillicaudatus]XP_055046102.1 lipopolysaccharide-induced tumor necrosis factor-alpha factor homolog isoform X2 [Misgurnus anguillicaudatus]XP_055046110.1 lipopolysaccharide-induced tumor necrosis factor-alpha factor homolog isoform X2 [Misgurnus anguillicaudatus]XP_055046119.1 lipopolysaccharide-induced tumor necrosis factor-alpha factor homolog isoform X2 [Misgurnus anguillicaudatus]XP_055046128.1 
MVIFVLLFTTLLYGCAIANTASKAMESALPMETAALVEKPLPPSYKETIGTNPQYPPGGPMPYPTTDSNQPQYPAQGHGPMYPPPPQPQPVNAPVVQTVYVQPGAVFREAPAQVLCPVCSQTVITQLEYTSGALAWLSCVGLACFGCISGCCLIPFCVDSLKDVTHRCPNCKRTLGVYKRI